MPIERYQDQLIAQLQDADEAAAYLTACYEDSEEVFLQGLRNVVEARGGIGKLSKLTELNRESLYRMLSEEGNPRLSTLGTVLDALGMQLLFAPDETKAA